MQKSVLEKALFSAFLFIFISGCQAHATRECRLSGTKETATVRAVTDGDTLSLTDGRKVRVLGIGSTEVNWKNRSKSDPYALEARKHLQFMLAKGSTVTLYFDTETQDKYQRLLAQVINAEGKDVGAEQIKAGLAYQYLFPPNEGLWRCYKALENEARRQAMGLWSQAEFKSRRVDQLSPKISGYQFVQGTVTSTRINANTWTVVLDETIHIHFKDLSLGGLISRKPPKVGDALSVRGYLNWREERAHVDVRHAQGLDE